MLLVYKISFITGVLYAVVSLILGNLFDSLDFDVDMDFDVPSLTILPIKPVTIVTFITVFGGVGIITSIKGFSTIIGFIISFCSAYMISLAVYRFIIQPLFKAQNTSSASQKDMVGLTAKVTSKIFENGYGQITYVNKGNTYTSPAKTSNGKAIESGSEVVIVSSKKGVFYVEPKEEYFLDNSFKGN